VKEQRARLERVRRERDPECVKAALARLREACRDENVNLMPPILEAVKAYATLGEICDEMRAVFGEYTPPIVV
jgi:methylmalonyl-CoA mutase N-terminal domain/subunit